MLRDTTGTLPVVFVILISLRTWITNNELIQAFDKYVHDNKECVKFLQQVAPFMTLDPLQDCTTPVIFWKLAEDDSFPQRYSKKFFADNKSEAVHPDIYYHLSRNESKAADQTEQAAPQATNETAPEEQSKSPEQSEDFQKKIIPWASLEYEENMYRDTLLTTKPRQDIIIIASLVDKVPNLAGLSKYSYCECNTIK
jgi:hypothetical protein